MQYLEDLHWYHEQYYLRYKFNGIPLYKHNGETLAQNNADALFSFLCKFDFLSRNITVILFCRMSIYSTALVSKRDSKWDIPLEDAQLSTEIIKWHVYNTKVGFIAERQKTLNNGWQINLLAKRIDWRRSKEATIRQNFVPQFLDAGKKLINFIDQNGFDDTHHRKQIDGSGGHALIISLYSQGDGPYFRYGHLPISNGVLQSSIFAIEWEVMGVILNQMKEIWDGAGNDLFFLDIQPEVPRQGSPHGGDGQGEQIAPRPLDPNNAGDASSANGVVPPDAPSDLGDSSNSSSPTWCTIRPRRPI